MRGDAILLSGTVVHERNDRTQCWFPRDVVAKLFGIVRIAQEPGFGGRRARADCNSPAAQGSLPAARISSTTPPSARLSGGALTIRYKRYNSPPPRNISGTDWRQNGQEMNAMAPVIRSKSRKRRKHRPPRKPRKRDQGAALAQGDS